MSETSTIEHLNRGYGWSYSLEVEKVVAVEGTRASAKTTEKYSLNGFTQTYLDARAQLSCAKEDIGKEASK